MGVFKLFRPFRGKRSLIVMGLVTFFSAVALGVTTLPSISKLLLDRRSVGYQPGYAAMVPQMLKGL